MKARISWSNAVHHVSQTSTAGENSRSGAASSIDRAGDAIPRVLTQLKVIKTALAIARNRVEVVISRPDVLMGLHLVDAHHFKNGHAREKDQRCQYVIARLAKRRAESFPRRSAAMTQ